ncbi:MAG TPA: type II toxin-antitoxin system HipA family toxin [Gemmatimonadales bacterium]
MFSVYLYDRPIGVIERIRSGIRFTYTPDAVDDPALHAVSVSLPKRIEPYGNRQAAPFFQNLLPEQAYKRLVRAAAETDPSDDIGLLGAIGGECPGAVSIWPGDERPSDVPEYRILSDDALEALFSPAGAPELGRAVTRGRLSLPGVQQKIALLRRPDGTWVLPLGGGITSHILKQPITEFPELLENELFCTTLAEKAGLLVPRTGLAAPTVRVSCAERFDRPMSEASGGAGRVKVHQEDFCQMRGVLPDKKYERDGGPGIAACAHVVRVHAALPARDLPNLLRWVAFNCFIGNEDAHAKNLAFLYTRAGLRLAPFYDLVSTVVYDHLERTLAMKIGGSWDVRNVQAGDWRSLAERMGLPWDVARPLILETADALTSHLGDVTAYCASSYGPAEVYSHIGTVAERHVKQTERELTS